MVFVSLQKINAMITKTQLMNTLNELPENMTIDQVIDKLIFLDKVQKGLDDSSNGRINSKEEARKKLNKWFK